MKTAKELLKYDWLYIRYYNEETDHTDIIVMARYGFLFRSDCGKTINLGLPYNYEVKIDKTDCGFTGVLQTMEHGAVRFHTDANEAHGLCNKPHKINLTAPSLTAKHILYVCSDNQVIKVYREFNPFLFSNPENSISLDLSSIENTSVCLFESKHGFTAILKDKRGKEFPIFTSPKDAVRYNK